MMGFRKPFIAANIHFSSPIETLTCSDDLRAEYLLQLTHCCLVSSLLFLSHFSFFFLFFLFHVNQLHSEKFRKKIWLYYVVKLFKNTLEVWASNKMETQNSHENLEVQRHHASFFVTLFVSSSACLNGNKNDHNANKSWMLLRYPWHFVGSVCFSSLCQIKCTKNCWAV